MAPVPSDSPTIAAVGDRPRDVLMAAPLAGFLSWLLPGLGHLYLGQRSRGIVCLITITATFWTGVAIGSVQATVDPRERSLWFLAQICTGGNTIVAYAWHAIVTPPKTHDRDGGGRSAAAAPVPHWLSVDVGVHYTGVAGLLNLLVILDCLGRAEGTGGAHGSRDRPKGAP